MKKKLLFMIPLLLCGLFMFANHKETRAAIISENYSYTQPASCPNSANYYVNTGARYRWIKISGVNYIQIQGEVGTRYGSYASWAGTDYFWLFDDRLNQNFQTWSFVRDLSGTPYNMSGVMVYRKETAWYTIDGEKPNKPTGYFYSSGTNYYLNVSGTANGTATYSHDYTHVRPGGAVGFIPSPGVSASVQDYITGFYYLINSSPTSIVTTTTPGVQISYNGVVDVSNAFKSGTLQYIHVVAKSFTGKLSNCLDLPIQDANLLRTLTLTGDAGIQSLIGAGSYYPGQMVTIDATPKEGYKFASWNKTTTTKNYTFTMPNANITYVAYSERGVLTKPSLTVSNPTDPGVYYNGGIYYLKADDTTKINLVGTCKLDPVACSRIDEVIIDSGSEAYKLSVPRADIVGGIFLPGNIESSNTLNSASVVYPIGDRVISDYCSSTLQFTQDFIANDNQRKDFQISSHASCIECTNANHQIAATGDTISIYGDNIAPTASISMKDTLRDETVGMGFFTTNWTNANSVKFNLVDNISGVKSYVLSKDGVTISSKVYDVRTVEADFNFATEEGENEYALALTDNVGNTRTYTFHLNTDKTKPTIEDLVPEFGVDNVKTTGGTWPKTNIDASWNYNWTFLKALNYKAEDVSGIRNLYIYNTETNEHKDYIKDATYTNTLTSIPFENTIPMVNGKNQLLIVVEDMAGNETQVNLFVRIDNVASKIESFILHPIDLEFYTIKDLNMLFDSGDITHFDTNVNFVIDDNFSTDDTSGIQKVEVFCKDPITNAVIKTYDVTDKITSNTLTKESAETNSFFSPLIRNLSGIYHLNLNTLEDLPTYRTLKISVQTTDYVGNVATSGEITTPNYAIKSVIHATKDEAYNADIDGDGKSKTAYFKTGEVGFIEVWAVGYVDTLKLDFSDQSVGEFANTAIANGQLLPRYKLGVKTGAGVRMLAVKPEFAIASSVPDVNGVSFLSHIKYSYLDVNNSMGDLSAPGIVNGWDSDGTMVRIPPSFTLEKKKLDGKLMFKNGMQLFEPKECKAYVWALKNNIIGPVPSTCNYVIWDESGDDLHYRTVY